MKKIVYAFICSAAIALSACGTSTGESGGKPVEGVTEAGGTARIEENGREGGGEAAAEIEDESDAERKDETVPETVMEEALDMSALKEAETGSTVSFGRYEQDGSQDNGPETLEWLVLAKEENRLLLISKYALECRAYHGTEEDITWETCDLRTWLNGEFFNTAFYRQEQSRILKVSINGGRNPQYNTDMGNETEDNIFLLSVEEAERYFPSDEERICSPTAYAVSLEENVVLNEAGNIKWWLRSPGKSSLCAATVFSGGGINLSGYDVRDTTGTVRPALWLDVYSAPEENGY